MKSKKILVGSVFLALFASSGASALDEYICHSEGISGFRKRFGDWIPMIFNDNLVVTLKEFGQSGNYTIVSEPALFVGTIDDDVKNENFIVAEDGSVYGRFVMSKGSLRFTLSQMRGYIHDGGFDFTPLMAVGKCKRL